MLASSLLIAVAAGQYAGSAACQTCHPVQYRAELVTAHARALAQSSADQPGDWAFGAGIQAITFVKHVDSQSYLELELSWFTRLNRYSRTPGHLKPGGVSYRIFDPQGAVLRCFGCHSTGAVTLAADRSIRPHEIGVRCEACHGPAAVHASDPSASRPLNPSHLDGNAMNELCGACHRSPSGSAEADLRDPWNVRHQPVMLAASRCFRESRGTLTCSKCHSPHSPLETRLDAYDRACSDCHKTPRHKVSIVATACVSCHMPAVTPTEGLSFANHRIGVYRPEDPLKPQQATLSSR